MNQQASTEELLELVSEVSLMNDSFCAVNVPVDIVDLTGKSPWMRQGSVVLVPYIMEMPKASYSSTADAILNQPPQKWVSPGLLKELQHRFGDEVDGILRQIAKNADECCKPFRAPPLRSLGLELLCKHGVTIMIHENEEEEAPITARSFPAPCSGCTEPRTHILQVLWDRGTTEMHTVYRGEVVEVGKADGKEEAEAQRVIVHSQDASFSVFVDLHGEEVPYMKLVDVVDMKRGAPDPELQSLIDSIPKEDIEAQEFARALSEISDIARRMYHCGEVVVGEAQRKLMHRVCLNVLEELTSSVKQWPDGDARLRIARNLPVLYEGLAKLLTVTN
jgi:hypothetical protein